MKLTIKKEVEETIEVELPAYFNYGGMTKILSENEYIQVQDDDGDCSVRVTKYGKSSIPTIINANKPIAARVFNNTLQSALSKLNCLLQQGDNHYPPEDVFNQIADIIRPETVGDADDLKHINI